MKLISTKILSQIIGVKESTLYAWTSKGSVPCYRLQGLIRFDEDEIMNWLKDKRHIPDRNPVEPQHCENNIERIVKRAIEGVQSPCYNSSTRGSQAKSSPERRPRAAH